MNHLKSCPECGEVVVKEDAGTVKVRGKLVVCKGLKSYAVCKRCDTEVEIPLTVDTDVVKSLAAQSPPIFIRNRRST